MSSARTVADLFRRSTASFETDHRTSTAAAVVDAARSRAAWLTHLPRGSGVLVDVADPVAALEIALGAWWVGHRVAFASRSGGQPAFEQALAVEASVHVRDDAGPSADAVVPMVDPAAVHGPPVAGPPRCAGSDVALDVLTSGTTGRPKCVVFDHAAFAANALAVADALGLSPDDRLWTSLPHGLPGVLSTVLLPATARNATAVLTHHDDPLFAGAALATSSPSVVYAVPAVYEAMAHAGRRRTDSVQARWWLSSSARLDPALFDAMRATWGATVRSFYCGSEVGTVTFNDAADVDPVRATVGRPLRGVRLRIDGERVIVGGDLVGLGYRSNGVVTPFPGSGIETGDLGRLDPDGNLHLVGRAGDRIHVGADVVDPAVVEDRVTSQPGIRECIAVPRTHRQLGSVVGVVVSLQDGAQVSPRDIITRCRADGLLRAWVPRHVTFVDAVPRTPAGKPDRRAAADLASR